MPTAPQKIKRQWVKEYKKHERIKDMTWFYNSWTWRKFSRRYKQNNPTCILCEQEGIVTPTKVTDHIKTYEQHPAGFDLDNLKEEDMQPLCDKHHNSKSGKEGSRFKGK